MRSAPQRICARRLYRPFIHCKEIELITCSNKLVRNLAVALVLSLLLFLALDHEMCIALKLAIMFIKMILVADIPLCLQVSSVRRWKVTKTFLLFRV